MYFINLVRCIINIAIIKNIGIFNTEKNTVNSSIGRIIKK